MSTISLCDSQRREQAGHPVIGDLSAGLVAKGTCEPNLAEPVRASDQNVLFASDPSPVDQLRHDGLVDPSRASQVQILHAGSMTQGRKLQTGQLAGTSRQVAAGSLQQAYRRAVL